MPSVLAELRAVVPPRPLAPWGAHQVAERQAARLLRRHGLSAPPVPEEVIAELPYVRVRYVRAKALAATARWSVNQLKWVILVNRDDTAGRRRFSLAHEFKHVVDHRLKGRIYRDRRQTRPTSRPNAPPTCRRGAADAEAVGQARLLRRGPP